MTLTVAVRCADCGKKLRGTEGVLRQISVRRHNRPDGTTCSGHRRSDHKPVQT